MDSPFAATVASFLVACTMLFALRPLAELMGLVDKPGGRKTHHGEVPVVGGIAMFAGLLIAALGGQGLGQRGGSLLAVSGFMVGLGALDDRFNLPASVRLFAHLSAAVALIFGTGYLVPNIGNLLGAGPIELGWLSLPVTVLAVVALINAFNMLDGLDGLAGSAGLVAFGGAMTIASVSAMASVSLVSGSMLGAVAAFLIFNMPAQFNRSIRTFMGDAGSTLLGFVLAALSLALLQPGGASVSPVILLWMMPLPVFELLASTVRRAARGRLPTAADDGHFHHVLIKSGFSVRAICLLYFLVSVSSCSFGVWAHQNAVQDGFMLLGLVAMFGVWLLFIRSSGRLVSFLPIGWRRLNTPGH